MGKNKCGRPSWFKVFLHQKPLIDAIPDEVAGRALKAALLYFDTGEMTEMDSLTGAVFAVLKPHIDEAFDDFRRSVDAGKAGSQKRWNKEGTQDNSPPIASLNNPIGVFREAEADADTDTEEEGEGMADKPPKLAPFSPPSVYDVRAYCDEQGYTTVDPERFVSYYQSINWMVGKSPMTDWKSKVQSWYRSDLDKNGKSCGFESGIDRLARMYSEEFGE